MSYQYTLSHHIAYKPKEGCSCGAEDAMFDFVPDTIFGLSIKRACCIHDDRYSRGGTQIDKQLADDEFLNNMLVIINSHKRWWYPHFLASHRAMTYYHAVRKHGNSSFNFKEDYE